ncbi:unnamed protein product [Leptidea sinapis]|uniref:Uncharacterized protein n=1 Tax=Leptidea sinapis TaxID=189913 RepID=A0A5E4QC43_9NEOP|nr:unnamed protein product [Leptidea sinapis]
MHIVKKTSQEVLYPLDSRGLLKVTGNESSVFLQGLITNDMQHFEEGAKSMYTMFLNNKGRVLYDTLIHKWGEENSYMIECDKQVVNLLQKHLMMYKLRRKVTIEDVHKQFKVWALITNSDGTVDKIIDGINDINLYKDPRLPELGCRVLSIATLSGHKIAEILSKDINAESKDDNYRYLRYTLGVTEGADDLPPGVTFPLEVNCDYLHGVSFHKGCYIGQEVTARVHHTGIVRKRIMPIKFDKPVVDEIERDSLIKATNNPKLSLGKLKGALNDYGLGLLRIKECLDAKSLSIGNYTAQVVKPNWWPTEAPKEVSKIDKELDM